MVLLEQRPCPAMRVRTPDDAFLPVCSTERPTGPTTSRVSGQVRPHAAWTADIRHGGRTLERPPDTLCGLDTPSQKEDVPCNASAHSRGNRKRNSGLNLFSQNGRWPSEIVAITLTGEQPAGPCFSIAPRRRVRTPLRAQDPGFARRAAETGCASIFDGQDRPGRPVGASTAHERSVQQCLGSNRPWPGHGRRVQVIAGQEMRAARHRTRNKTLARRGDQDFGHLCGPGSALPRGATSGGPRAP